MTCFLLASCFGGGDDFSIPTVHKGAKKGSCTNREGKGWAVREAGPDDGVGVDPNEYLIVIFNCSIISYDRAMLVRPPL